MKIDDKISLAQEGFTLIRNLLKDQRNESIELAKEVADSLHNLSSQDNAFTDKMTIERISELEKQYPDCASFKSMTSLFT